MQVTSRFIYRSAERDKTRENNAHPALRWSEKLETKTNKQKVHNDNSELLPLHLNLAFVWTRQAAAEAQIYGSQKTNVRQPSTSIFSIFPLFPVRVSAA